MGSRLQWRNFNFPKDCNITKNDENVVSSSDMLTCDINDAKSSCCCRMEQSLSLTWASSALTATTSCSRSCCCRAAKWSRTTLRARLTCDALEWDTLTCAVLEVPTTTLWLPVTSLLNAPDTEGAAVDGMLDILLLPRVGGCSKICVGLWFVWGWDEPWREELK